MRGMAIGVVILLATGCHAGDGGRTELSTALVSEAEALAGARAAPGLELRHGGIVAMPGAVLRMNRVGDQLACAGGESLGEFKFAVLASRSPNAFSLPGGLIYITRGLYDRIEDDQTLAAVLAHEMAHIEAKDSLKPRCRNKAEALEREIAADLRGCEVLVKAGYEAADLVALVKQLDDEMPSGWSDARCERLCASHPAAAGGSLRLCDKLVESAEPYEWESIIPPEQWLLLASQVRLLIS